MALQKIARRTLSDEVFEQLTAEIVHGTLTPGASLPPERELVAQLGVNRGAVREALQRLAQAGLVRIQQGGGTRVLDFRRSAGLGILDRLLVRPDGEVDLRVARGIVEMRAALAPDIARLCARRRDAEVLASLEAGVAAMASAAGDLEQLQALSIAFWEALVRGADNIAYELAFNSLKETYHRIRELMAQVLSEELQDLAGYRALASAVGDGDEERARQLAAAVIEKGTRRVSVLIALLAGAQGAEGAARGGRP